MSSNIIDKDRIQVIRGDHGPTHAVVPWELWTEIEAALAARRTDADLSDEELFDTADTSGETFPMEVVEELVAGTHPVKVYRRYRDLTQADLARAVGSTAAYISQIENGRPCGRSTLAMLARALDVDMEDLIPRTPEVSELPQVTRDHDPKWYGDRDSVSFVGMFTDPRTGGDAASIFRISVEALADLSGSEGLSGQSAVAAFLTHEARILEVCGRAIAEGRSKRDGAIPIVTADFD
jgi:transcriptional regulator with XRE-family HTH domain